jgi:hypothetical protein
MIREKWRALVDMELSSLTLATQLLTQEMIGQVHEFQTLQSQALHDKTQQMCRHISLLSMMFQRILKQTSMFCPNEARMLAECFQRIELVFSQLETYWILRYQRDMMVAFRQCATFLYALVTLLLKEVRSPTSVLSRYCLVRQEIDKLLEDQQTQIQQFSIVGSNHESEFRSKVEKIFTH